MGTKNKEIQLKEYENHLDRACYLAKQLSKELRIVNDMSIVFNANLK